MLDAISKLRMPARPALLAGAAIAQAEVYLYIDSDGDGDLEETTLGAATPSVSGKQPVLFVHGHDLDNPDDSEFNFRKN